MRESKYTRAVLEPVVTTSKTLGEVIRRFGLPATGGNDRYFSAAIRRAELDTSHFRGATFRKRINAIPRDRLANVTQSAKSIAQILDALAMRRDGRAHHELRRRLAELEIDTSHLRGQAWNRGETRESHPSVAAGAKKIRIPDEEVFCERSRITIGYKIVKRLRRMGWENKCQICGISDWQGKPLTLQLDHINGIHDDNRLTNLRYLCANCHSQTDTFCRRGH
jgi:hypothetical protein